MKFNLGKVTCTPRGEYNAETEYRRLDIISYNGSSYQVIADSVTGVTPEVGENYMLIASKGDTGGSGEYIIPAVYDLTADEGNTTLGTGWAELLQAYKDGKKLFLPVKSEAIYIGEGVTNVPLAFVKHNITNDHYDFVFKATFEANRRMTGEIEVDFVPARTTLFFFKVYNGTDDDLMISVYGNATLTGMDIVTSGINGSTISSLYYAKKIPRCEQVVEYVSANKDGFEKAGNKVTSLTAEATDTQYPSAKAVYDALQDHSIDDIVNEVLNALPTWNGGAY